jgi:hypothetical protein
MDTAELDGTGLLRNTLGPPEGLLHCDTVLDIGAGIRPFAWYKPSLHQCVEPYPVYVSLLRRAGFEVFSGTAEEALREGLQAEQVLLLDVIEHMDKDMGRRVVELAKQAAIRQVVIYTPLGFKEQQGDAWGLGGDTWQLHRSGWTPEEFDGWTIVRRSTSFFALWNA